jgi:hypothetical protein
MGWTLDVKAPANGRIHRAEITVLDDDGGVMMTDSANLHAKLDRQKLARRLAASGVPSTPEEIERKVEECWNAEIGKRRAADNRQRATPAAADNRQEIAILDTAPDTIRRPLCLLGGTAYAASWLYIQTTVHQAVNPDTGEVITYDPPQVKTEPALVVVRGDGQVFVDAKVGLQGAQPLARLGVLVFLAAPPHSAKTWSGAGVKRYLAGEYPRPADVFRRVTEVVDRFMDFGRSLAPQTTMCELVGCFVLGTYLLDAFHVVGYLWPNGDKGTGKTNLLFVVAEMAYLGEVILAGGSFASLRDLADYGATLAFDDAEGIMDLKRADPDKRALLLAGNRRGSYVTVKELVGEQWVTRHVHTFCPRLFSAIQLPDNVLGSRAVTVPLVRSADPRRAKVSPQDYSVWPCDRRRLVDDLWALGLAHLPALKDCDAQAAGKARLAGRDLEPWRVILGVALWLQEKHQVGGLFDRMEALSVNYQTERGDLEARDAVRVAVRALGQLVAGREPDERVTFSATDLAGRMNQLAGEDDPPEQGKDFTNPRKVGWLLKRQRFQREGAKKTRLWRTTLAEVAAFARAYGMALEPEAEEPWPD